MKHAGHGRKQGTVRYLNFSDPRRWVLEGQIVGRHNRISNFNVEIMVINALGPKRKQNILGGVFGTEMQRHGMKRAVPTKSHPRECPKKSCKMMIFTEEGGLMPELVVQLQRVRRSTTFVRSRHRSKSR
jgi:hypothetical protein